MLDLRVATPQIVINYASFLEDSQYFEEAFKVRCFVLKLL
jgi:pre-mRNA-splicing factor SYF1